MWVGPAEIPSADDVERLGKALATGRHGERDQLMALWGFRTRPLVLTWALCGSFVFADEVAEDGPALDPRLGQVRDRVVGPGRA